MHLSGARNDKKKSAQNDNRKVLRMASGQPLEISAYADSIELARKFTLAAVFSIGAVVWIDILDTAWELSSVLAEVTHPTITKTPANESWDQLEPRQPRLLQRLVSHARSFTPTTQVRSQLSSISTARPSRKRR
jgi:hypothetical protein